MQAFIDFLLAFGRFLWPLSIIEFHELGLRTRLGKYRDELQPGWYWRWWWEKIEVVSSAEDFIDLGFGDVPTKDGQSITFSANVGYRIVSPYKLWLNMNDPDENLSRLALGKLADLVCTKSWPELAGGQAQIKRWLKERLSSETVHCGIQVTRVFITTLVKPRPFRVYSEGGWNQ